ncbi:hypothetical protein AAC387_Pa09g1413 [Persea americana]
MKVVDSMRDRFGDDYYICRFQEPATAEEDFALIGTATIMKIFLLLRDPGPLIVPKRGFADWRDTQIILPSWLSEVAIRFYADSFNKTGFTGGLNYYRNLDLNWELEAPWTGAQVKVAAKFIVGDMALTFNTLGTKEYINSGLFNKGVPFLNEVVIIKGAGHFIHEERPDQITDHIHDIIQKH